MPVPKGFPYGKIIGHLINSGYSPREAKAKTEKVMADHPGLKAKISQLKSKMGGKKTHPKGEKEKGEIGGGRKEESTEMA